MKNYNEIAESVLKRRDKYIADRNKQMKRVTFVLSCFCFAALLIISTGIIYHQKPLDSSNLDYDDNDYSVQEQVKKLDSSDTNCDAVGDYSTQESIKEKDNSTLLVSYYESAEEACYKAPGNGDIYMSIPLSRAIEAYGDDANYQVLVQVFQNEVALDSKSAEVQGEIDRLTALGYPIVFEQGTSYAFSLIASREQLQGIPSGQNYGYFLFLYGEFFNVSNAVSETDSTDTLHSDVPVQGDSGNTGALIAYEEVWGGSYMDQNGCWVIWLTKNTSENQKMIFERNPDLLESNTTFKTADYSHAYLTELMADISESMGDGKLPYVSTAAFREEINRVVVTMTTDDTDCLEKVFSFDEIGGAIEIQYSSRYVKDETIEKCPAE